MKKQKFAPLLCAVAVAASLASVPAMALESQTAAPGVVSSFVYAQGEGGVKQVSIPSNNGPVSATLRYMTGSKVGTIGVAGKTTLATQTRGWTTGSGPATASAWDIQLDTTGYTDLTFSADQATTGKAPGKWKLAYSLDNGGTYQVANDVPEAALPKNATDDATALTASFTDASVPDGVTNIRVYMSDATYAGGGLNPVDSTSGNTSINNIQIKGTSTSADIVAPPTIVTSNELPLAYGEKVEVTSADGYDIQYAFGEAQPTDDAWAYYAVDGVPMFLDGIASDKTLWVRAVDAAENVSIAVSKTFKVAIPQGTSTNVLAGLSFTDADQPVVAADYSIAANTGSATLRAAFDGVVAPISWNQQFETKLKAGIDGIMSKDTGSWNHFAWEVTGIQGTTNMNLSANLASTGNGPTHFAIVATLADGTTKPVNASEAHTQTLASDVDNAWNGLTYDKIPLPDNTVAVSIYVTARNLAIQDGNTNINNLVICGDAVAAQ